MKKYTVHKEKQELPSDEKIMKQQDFGKLFHEYENVTKRPKKPMYKDPKYLFLMLLLVLIAFLIVEATNEEKEDNPTEQLSE